MGKSKLLFCLLFISVSLKAQQAYYLCYFTDKPTFNQQTVKPIDFLSEKAVLRRLKNEVSFTVSDYPVHQVYLDSLKVLSIPVKITSKWFNAALVMVDSTQKKALEATSFIDSVQLVSRLLQGGNSQRKTSFGLSERSVGNYFSNEQTLNSYTDRGEGVKIAVFDAGFLGVNILSEFQHLFDGNRVTTYDFLNAGNNAFQYHDHGTMVFSVLASEAALAPHATYELYVTEDVSIESRIEEVYWLRAAEMADSSGVDIINSSLGYSLFHTLPEEDYTLSDLDGKTSIISRAANYATSKGIVVVTSAGNDGNVANWGKLTVPADAFEVISVGAVNQLGIRPSFSSVGPATDGRVKPEIMALGVGAAVVNKNGNTVSEDGTSFSAPAIAGVCALLLQQDTTLTTKAIKQRIVEAGDRFKNPDNEYGYGILDFDVLMGNVVPKVFQPDFYFTNDGREINFLNVNKNLLVVGMYTLEGKVLYKGSNSSALFTVPYPLNIPLVILKVVSEDSSSVFFFPNSK